MRRAFLRALELIVFFEALQWVACGVLALGLAYVVWTRSIPSGDDALLLAASRYQKVGGGLFAAFGIVLLGSGLREGGRAVRGRP